MHMEHFVQAKIFPTRASGRGSSCWAFPSGPTLLATTQVLKGRDNTIEYKRI